MGGGLNGRSVGLGGVVLSSSLEDWKGSRVSRKRGGGEVEPPPKHSVFHTGMKMSRMEA